MSRIEDHYWWFLGRRSLVVGLARDLVDGPDPLIVDVGCGTGANARALAALGRVVGLDASPLALGHAGARGLGRPILGDAQSLPIADGVAELVVATDIIEHLDDDGAALREFRRVLRPGGHAIVTVPAYMFLWSEHDEALMHRRRYTAGLLRHRVEEAGFEVPMLSHHTSLLFPLALTRLLGRRRARAGPAEAKLTPVPAPINRLLTLIQRAEAAAIRRVALPWGLGIAAVLRKPDRMRARRGPHRRRLARGRVGSASPLAR